MKRLGGDNDPKDNATPRKRCNTIESLKVEGSNVTDPTDIKEAIKSFYENLYKEIEVWRPELQLQQISCINEDEEEDNPYANINECWTSQGWDLIFGTFLNDWKVERVAKLLELLEKFSGITNGPGSLRWKHSKDGVFTYLGVHYAGRQQRPTNIYSCIATLQHKFESSSLVSQRQIGSWPSILLTC
ncbi:hypothetical protein H5410_057037 [Solanum commersonii]|uniref:Uncharacterized protein n=1 Tax=Solanum commersonii TaxID=4109 RepID=A0A9J5WNZ6_SOLCO|nr:hypothetical protein H5410_057037 [Solanum commersonii]